MRLLALLLLASLPVLAQNEHYSDFPNTLDSDDDFLVATNRSAFPITSLTSGITDGAITIPVASAVGFVFPGTIAVDSELIKVVSRSGNSFNVLNVTGVAITDCSNTVPAVVTTSVDHNMTGSEWVTITGVGGNTACNVVFGETKPLTATTFELTGVNGNGAYTTGGTVDIKGRGFDGTTPANHSSGAPVAGYFHAHHYNLSYAAIKNVQNALGTNLDNVVEPGESNTFTTGPQIFTATATDEALRITCSALPSSPTAGALACDSGASNLFKAYDGSAWRSTAFPDPGSNGLLSRTALDTLAARTLTAPAAGFTIADGDGVAGNPTFSLANDLSALEGIGTTGLAVRSAADTWLTRSITQPAAGITVTNGDGIAGNPTLALADDLAALEALASTGITARTAADTWAARTLTAGSTQLTV